jgi:hypothetical protein
VIKRSNLKRQTVELGQAPVRASRIRRDPVPIRTQKEVRPYPTEREIWTVVIGVVLFALAITAITVGTSNYIVS